MQKTRRQKSKQAHYCLLVNTAAGRYSERAVDRLAAAIKQEGSQYTILRPESAADMLDAARAACGARRGKRFLPQQFSRRGKVTALVACGGDGSINLAARAALQADIPLGCLPLGRFNNIASSLCEDVSIGKAIEKLLSRTYRTLDVGEVSGQIFLGSIGLGLGPELARRLADSKRPRFFFGWSSIGQKAAAAIEARSLEIKVDAFRFEITSRMVGVHLLPRAYGLPMTPASIPDDSRAEVIFDVECQPRELGAFISRTSRRKYLYGDNIRLFRGSVITIQPVQGRTMCLDGELVSLPATALEIEVGERQLKFFC